MGKAGHKIRSALKHRFQLHKSAIRARSSNEMPKIHRKETFPRVKLARWSRTNTASCPEIPNGGACSEKEERRSTHAHRQTHNQLRPPPRPHPAPAKLTLNPNLPDRTAGKGEARNDPWRQETSQNTHRLERRERGGKCLERAAAPDGYLPAGISVGRRRRMRGSGGRRGEGRGERRRGMGRRGIMQSGGALEWWILFRCQGQGGSD